MTRKTLLSLLLLTLAAASSAQTFVLNPVAVRGYTYRASNASTTLTSALSTFATLRPFNTLMSDGWRAEFALPTTPPGARLVSARLAARGTVVADGLQTLNVKTYAGTGTITPVPGPYISTVLRGPVSGSLTLDLNVTSALGTSSIVGFNFSCDSPQFNSYPGWTSRVDWSGPALTLTYAPVPEPASLAALGLGALGLLRRRRTASR